MTVAFLGPDGVNSVQLSNPNNKSKVVDAADLALDSVMKGRVGTGGGLSFRNKIIDGRFDFWYEGTSQTANGYGSATMWLCSNIGTTKTHSRQNFVAGVDLPCIDFPSAKYFSRTVVSSVSGVNNFASINQNIEDVTTFAGKTVTLSFYAKADAVKNIAVCLSQGMGTGGSANVLGIGAQLLSLSTAWQRYSVQMAVPSLSGKIVGAGNNIFQLSFIFDAGSTFAELYGVSALGQQSGTFDIACVQLEEGSVATPFEDLPMAISQWRVNRYYQKIGGSQYGIILQAVATAAGQSISLLVPLSTEMRINPVKTKYGTWLTGNFSLASPRGNDAKSFFINGTSVTAGVCGFNTVDSTTYVTLDARL